MTTTDPEHGTREWSEDPVGDLLKMYQTIKDAFEKITEDIKRFSEGRRIMKGYYMTFRCRLCGKTFTNGGTGDKETA